MNEYRNVILQGDVRARLRELPDESVQCIVTSPPYWGLRDYGTAKWEGGDAGCDHIAKQIRTGLGLAELGEKYRGGGHKQGEVTELQYGQACPKCGATRIDNQLGLERTPEEYVAKMVVVFREVRRVLRDDGTLWLNLGDSYAQNGSMATKSELAADADRAKARGYETQAYAGYAGWNRAANTAVSGLKPKDLCMIPATVAIALRADGWYLRQDIIWSKPNPMPESVTDRCTKSHEYVFLMSKSAKYYYDNEAVKESGVGRETYFGSENYSSGSGRNDAGSYDATQCNNRNRRSVWHIATAPFAEAHFATYPPKLIEPMILAGTSEKGNCANCGKPWERVVENEPNPSHGTRKPKQSSDDTGLDAGQNWNEHREYSGALITKTLGWRPACPCYGLEIISDQPVKPSKKKDETEEDYGNRRAIYEAKLAKWYADWERLKPLYAAQTAIVPAVVLDPFGGAGTTGLVARRLKRDYTLIELNGEYCEMAQRRIDADDPDKQDYPLFNVQKRIDGIGEMLPLEAT